MTETISDIQANSQDAEYAVASAAAWVTNPATNPYASTATAAPRNLLWARAERALAATAASSRREVVAMLRATGFRLDTEQLGLVCASRGSRLGGATMQPDKLPIGATIRLSDVPGGCTVSIEIVDRWPAGLGRMVGADGAYRTVFDQVLGAFDTTLGRLDPGARAGFSQPQYASNAAASTRQPSALARSRSTVAGHVNRVLDGPGSGPGSRSWRTTTGATLISPSGVATLDIPALQMMATVGTQLVDNPGAVPGEQVARVAELVRMLDERLSAPAATGYATRVDVTAEQVAVVEFLRQQARIREQVELRMRQRCLTCNMEKIVNPDYKELVRRNQKTKIFSSSFGGIIGKSGISPFVLVGKLLQLKQLDPDYVCPRCQGMHAETVIITFCPNCHERHDEPVLRTCGRCDHDFAANLPAEQLWEQVDPATLVNPATTTELPWQAGGSPRGSWLTRLGSAVNTTAPLPSAAAGWYADPSGTAQLRWWDGYAWTEHVHPAAQLGGGVQ